MQSKSEIKKYIDEKYVEFKKAGDKTWLFEEIEREVIFSIFRYCNEKGYEFEGFDLELILEGDEEDLPESRMEMFFDLMRRLGGNLNEGNIEPPDDVAELLTYYEKTFYSN
jgi:hypothetical protein